MRKGKQKFNIHHYLDPYPSKFKSKNKDKKEHSKKENINTNSRFSYNPQDTLHNQIHHSYHLQSSLINSLQHLKYNTPTHHSQICQKHKQKKATNYVQIQNNKRIPYCNYCSIKLSKLGYNIYSINDLDLQAKKKEVKVFLKQIEQVQVGYKQAINLINQRIKEIQEYYSSILAKNDQYYSQLHTIIENLQRKSNDPIINTKKLIIEELEENIKSLQSPYLELQEKKNIITFHVSQILSEVHPQELKQALDNQRSSFTAYFEKLKVIYQIDMHFFAFQDGLSDKVESFRKIAQNYQLRLQNQNEGDSLLCSQKNSQEYLKQKQKQLLFSFQNRPQQKMKFEQNKLFGSPVFKKK